MRKIEIILLLSCVLISGCSSIVNSHRQKEPMMHEYMAGSNTQVIQRVNDKLSSTHGTGDEIMWQLEAGAIYFNTQQYDKSVEHFKRAEELIEQYDQRALISLKDGSEEGAALVTNLNALPYRGFCRDRVALSIYKSLAYLGVGNEEAFRAQLRRLRDEQKKVQDEFQKFFDAQQAQVDAAKKKNPDAAAKANANTIEKISADSQNKEFNAGLKNSRQVANKGYGDFLNPMAIFLSGLGLVRDGNFENARIDFQRLYEAMPNSQLTKQYYVSVLKKAKREVPEELKDVEAFDFPLERDCLYVVLANGRSGAFKQIAIYFPVMVAWPMCEFYPAPYSALAATANGKTYQSTTIANMDGIIAQEFDQRLPAMITRIILATAIKDGARYTATYVAAQENDLLAAGVFAGTSIYTALMNTADTRSWEILPKEFQITQLPMPQDRKVSIKLLGGRSYTKEIDLPNANSAIIFVNAPSHNNISYDVFPLK